ncbi:hypothetical protein SLEP1_g41011 [Rubroshorea leprosula]|uniref:Uncharacterized protein n=1 Tax=Rubroshorea leprosula TaxID=152421 RepID=A0AAV5L5H3_9ROSI|nr:hypothetical protein SLEP1_g41011 [Rubroshorea leprosula]
MILEQILKFDLQILMVSDVNWISFELCAFMGPSHKCTASITFSDLDSRA